MKEIDAPPMIDPNIPIAATAYTEDGRMLCIVGEKWNEYTDELKVEILSHEAGHVSGGHDVRMQDRDGKLWNIVCDAAIHYSGGVQEWAIQELGGVTYEKLNLPPVPPEIAYDMLPPQSPNGGEGCGREQNQGKELSDKALSRALVAAIRGGQEIGEGFMGGSSRGSSRMIPDTIPPVPEWVREVLDRLKKAVAYDDPTRRWVKETRRDVEPIMMPGKAPRLGVACTFIWDISGSISQEEVLKFLSAVEGTPELANSEVVAFSDRAVGPRSVRYAREVAEECGSGGTSFMSGAKKRRPGVPAVWITDGYTGDGWPQAHDADEIWIMSTDVTPPHGIVVRAS